MHEGMQASGSEMFHGLLALVLIGIRDSWDLGTYLLQKERDRR